MSPDVPTLGQPRRIAGWLVLAAVAWSLGLLVLAYTLPVEIDETYTRPGLQPRYSLVHINGASVLWIVAIPLLASLSVGALLLLDARRRSPVSRRLATAVAGVVTIAGFVGTVTILIGVFVVPAGLLLLAASLSVRPKRLPVQGWYVDPSDPAHRRWWDGQDWTGHTVP